MMTTPTLRSDAASTLYSPKRFASSMLKVRTKSMEIVPLRYNRVQRHYLQNRTSRDLILKARQMGMSTAIQAELTRYAWTRTSSSLTMADVGDNTSKFRRMSERFYENLPDNCPKPLRSESNATTVVYPELNSETAIATAGQKTGGRASTYNIMHGSEVAFWRNADEVIAGALQAIPIHGWTWVAFESTANGQSGWFYDECMAALQGDSVWKLHFYEWWWDEGYWLPLDDGEIIEYTDEEKSVISKALSGGFTLRPEHIKWRREKQLELKHKFQQEYPESPHQAFLSTGSGVFGEFEHALIQGADKPVYNPDHRYVAGIDWGQENDFTAISIIDMTADREVVIDRWNKRSWDWMLEKVLDYCAKWHVEMIQPEKNSIGSVNIERMIDKLNERKRAGTIDRIPSIRKTTMTNKKKAQLVSLLYNSLHDDPPTRFIDADYATAELRSFTQKQSATGLYIYEHAQGQHDDTVIARALSNDAARRAIR